MRLLVEVKEIFFTSEDPTTKIHCKVYEDNSGDLTMAKGYKYRPRTKFLNIELHHFRVYVELGEVTIHNVSIHDQPTDYLTNPLDELTHKNTERKYKDGGRVHILR